MEKCQYCGMADESVATHSNTLECGKCWTYRKLDRPAALHWAKVAANQEEGFLSNIDMYDLTKYFKKAGLEREEAATMLNAAWKLYTYSKFLKQYGPEHTWDESVKITYQQERDSR